MNSAMSDKSKDVHPRADLFQDIKIFPETVPRRMCCLICVARRHSRDCCMGTDGGTTDSALADNFCRNTLMNLAFSPPVCHKSKIGMGMEIDETGGDDQPADINDFCGF